MPQANDSLTCGHACVMANSMGVTNSFVSNMGIIFLEGSRNLPVGVSIIYLACRHACMHACISCAAKMCHGADYSCSGGWSARLPRSKIPAMYIHRRICHVAYHRHTDKKISCQPPLPREKKSWGGARSSWPLGCSVANDQVT